MLRTATDARLGKLFFFAFSLVPVIFFSDASFFLYYIGRLRKLGEILPFCKPSLHHFGNRGTRTALRSTVGSQVHNASSLSIPLLYHLICFYYYFYYWKWDTSTEEWNVLSGSHTTAWSHEVGLGPKSSPPRQGSERIFPVPQYLGQVSPTQHLQSPLRWKLFHSCNLHVRQD